MGSAEVMLNKYKSRTTRDAEIVAIRDSVAATWNTYGTTDATGKEIYRFLKKYKIDGCVVIKIKSKDGACKALGDYVELFKTDGKYKYCNMPCGPPSSLRLGNSEKLGRVMVAYYDAESD
jgi:hypothetical protein